ncbi:hypothetical protein M407DRAFT_147128 [Tulasnella calospora MUT 4182]|uniref:Uncharacterized protein n=1 Tax=Tulasnella calospora MUT 4182 TaxID=1051891 RepID=A0A0C3Q7J3_9AGAM|nr:hypothetical protein M407DRAFT_147128 [Tulasnella calospora MUT 4182]
MLCSPGTPKWALTQRSLGLLYRHRVALVPQIDHPKSFFVSSFIRATFPVPYLFSRIPYSI